MVTEYYSYFSFEGRGLNLDFFFSHPDCIFSLNHEKKKKKNKNQARCEVFRPKPLTLTFFFFLFFL